MKSFSQIREQKKSCPHCDMMDGEHEKDCPMMKEENLDEISLDDLTKKISNTGMKNVRKDMKTDKLKQDLLKMRQKAKAAGVTEKTLTPAEKKKREEIAKAIERDNPDMPMDKKMAIATAQAKKVAE